MLNMCFRATREMQTRLSIWARYAFSLLSLASVSCAGANAQVIGHERGPLLHYLESAASADQGIFSASCNSVVEHLKMTSFLVLPRSKTGAYFVELGNDGGDRNVVANIGALTIDRNRLDVTGHMGGNWVHDNMIKTAKLLLSGPMAYDTSYKAAFTRTTTRSCAILTTSELLDHTYSH